VAGPLKIVFLNIEGLRNKLGNNDFLALLAAHDIFGIAESWAGFEKFDVRGYTGYVKGRGRIEKFGRNPEGLIVYRKDSINNRVKEIQTTVKEVIWIGLKAKTNSDVELCMGFIYNAPQNSWWYNPNFTLEFEEEVNLMRDLYPLTEIN
jgi:hypothetical protein